MTDRKMKIAQVGVANFGAHRRKIMRESGLFDLVAAYDLNPEALKQCQAEDGATPINSYEALLETPDIEAVVISTGAKFHAEQVIAAAEKGLHVFVEKPLCSTPEEINQLLEVQKRTGVVVGLGHCDHSSNAISLRTKELIDNELGTIATFEKVTAHNGGLLIQPGDWRGEPQKNPGGMLFQCGVHGIHELMFYFGPITHVQAMFRDDANPNTGTVDVACCQFRFASGLIGTLNAYHVTPYRHTCNILGTKASLYRDDRFFDEGTELLLQRAGEPGKKEPRESVAIDESKTDICGGMRSFYEAIRNGTQNYPSLIDGARAVAVVFAAMEAARYGGPVKVRAI